jgi:hypothetical protein
MSYEPSIEELLKISNAYYKHIRLALTPNTIILTKIEGAATCQSCRRNSPKAVVYVLTNLMVFDTLFTRPYGEWYVRICENSQECQVVRTFS